MRSICASMRSRRFSQAEMCWCIHASVACRTCGSILQVRTRPIFSELMSPLCSRARTCLSSDGRANSNGSESSLTDFGPSHKRLTIARLVGSASAENALSKSIGNLAMTESIGQCTAPVKKNFQCWLTFRFRPWCCRKMSGRSGIIRRSCRCARDRATNRCKPPCGRCSATG